MNYITLNPTVKVAINKSILKHYLVDLVNTVYLKDNTDFMLELFNPLSEIILAKISFNGKLISNSGIVLYPGQRIFLDRFLNDNYKLKFNTYQVDQEGLSATSDNGKIEVFFYKEKQYYFYNHIFRTSNSNATRDLFFSTNSDFQTGIIDKGEQSNQKFQKSYNDFESWYFSSETIKILPESKKVYSIKDINKQKQYCPFCGKKVKSNDNYCSNCGEKL